MRRNVQLNTSNWGVSSSAIHPQVHVARNSSATIKSRIEDKIRTHNVVKVVGLKKQSNTDSQPSTQTNTLAKTILREQKLCVSKCRKSLTHNRTNGTNQ